MKNKSARHKDANTFKFQPFCERIANIDVDVFHKVEHENEEQSEELSCYFHQAVDKWNVLNLSESYNLFIKEVKAHSYITLPQLILSKKYVVEVLLKHLRQKNSLCLQPLLEIVVAVAKDLQKDFYEYYPQFFEVILDVLNTKDTEQLEWAFQCLAYLFKLLWRTLVKDINSVFISLLPLLSDNKPDYIRSFAAESFAFVARKVKDRKGFLGLLLKAVKTKRDGASGCGKLLFEVMHGIEGQFHSYATTMLPFLFESLLDENFPEGTLFEILEHIIANIVLNIKTQNSELLWKTFLTVLDDLCTKWSKNKDIKVSENIELILKLVGQSIEYKSGRLLQNPVPIIKQLENLLNNTDLTENNLITITQISILLLLSQNIKLPQEQASGIVRKILSLPQKSVLLYFVDNISDYSSFEPLILPTFLKHCATTNLNSECFYILTKLILKKSPLCETGINYSNWMKYPIDFGNQANNSKILNILLKYIQIENIEDLFLGFDNYFCALTSLPHLNLVKDINIVEVLEENIISLLNHLKNTETSKIKKVLFLLQHSIECLGHFTNDFTLKHNEMNVIVTLLQFSTRVEYISSLKSISLLLTMLHNNSNIITIDTLNKINETLETNFNSPYHEIRLITTHIYTLFEQLEEFKLRHSTDPEVKAVDFKIFTICHTVESIDSQVQTYRDQLQNLEKLEFDKPQMQMCIQTNFKTIPLRYLCGTLFINFQLLWEPIIKIMETHAHGLDLNTFWGIFVQEIKNVGDNISNTKESEIDLLETECDVLGDIYQESQKPKNKPDFINYRLLLWKTMTHFSDIAEAKTRDVSELFLNFIDTEYVKNNPDMAITCSIKEYSNVEVEDPENEEMEEDKSHNDAGKPTERRNGKANLKTLLHMLIVFSKVRSPKSMYREADLYKLYFDLLQHKNHEVQKHALDCIMTYKFKYLTPYKDNLYNLIDDKKFKNEVTAFKVDKTSGIVQPEHRDDLIPLVMQIVFSKMNVKTGMRTGGKSSGQMRRGLVFRFLAGCEENEMLNFVQKSFRLFLKHLNDDPEVLHENVVKSINLEKFTPPKRLLSAINLLNVVLEQFGGLMGNQTLTFLFNILLVVGSIIKGSFDNLSSIHAGYLASLRTIRTSCIKIVGKFFEHFDRYPWTNKQINAIFSTFVWPYLDKLNIEGIHSPTTLLKLIVQWGSNPRTFALLVKHQENNTEQYVLPHVANLLVNKKSHGSVVNCIFEMFEKLLSLLPDEVDEQNKIQVDNLLPIKKDILDRISVNDKLNYGSCILLPHVPTILQKIKTKLEGKAKTLNQRELFVLSRISELVWEADISDKILRLLLPIIHKRCSTSAGEEVITQLLTTILNLINNVSDPEIHLKQITPLFAEVTYPGCRKQLTQILNTISTKSNLENLNTAFSLIDELNAWDAKWLDQPDFQRRHDAFKKIKEVITSGNIDVQFGVLLIYNCYFLIKSEKDLSLRENSSDILKCLCPVLIKKYQSCSKDLEYILNNTIFTLIRTGMKNRNNDLRNECISLLGHLARECPDSHFILRDLNVYTNKVDLEVDFFENLTHLQIHRHARGLLKFCQITKELKALPNPRTLTQFIMPLASFYLCSEKYANKNSVVDASIEAIGTVCRILPWHQYEGMLKYYLSKLRINVEYQKQLVRLTVAILDSFHFDLTKGHLVKEEIQKPVDIKTKNESKQEVEENIEDEENKEDQENIEELDVDDALNVEEIKDDEEEVVEIDTTIKVYDKVTVLCKSTATRVIRIIQHVLLPDLHKSLAVMTQHEGSHKLNRKRTGIEREEEDMLRVPISLAVVKLLQRLPQEILELNLPGVFMKLCTFLKSPLDSVRRVARETLQKIMLGLGPKYLRLLLGEMAPLLSRGFQVHVLVFTLHGVLNCLKDMYEPTDIDKILITVIELCTADLFGKLSEEKEITKIVTKVSEAKSIKSLDTLQIVAQYITETCLMDLILPIKQVLEKTFSFKIVQKAQESLRHIALGLVDNTFISLESLLKFAYGTASESIPQLIPKEKKVLTEKEREILSRQREDCLILPKMPTSRNAYRSANVKNSLKTNAHLLVEFGLRLCYFMLKREKVKDSDYKPYIDPFVQIFRNCLKSKHIKLSTLTLHCLSWIMKYDLPSMEKNIRPISKEIFGILHKYASSGLSKGDNFDLVVAAFKAMAVLVRDVKYHTVDATQLKALLLYAEQDMYDHDRQATAFNLLKAIVSRKLIVPEIHEIMKKVGELSVTSELNYVRAQARNVFYQFLMEYPMGKIMEKYIGFYVSQMSYELQYGRESAYEMIQTMINSFPPHTLKENSGTFFISLGARLVNDEVPECRRTVADCITSLLSKLTKADREPLFEIVVLWLKDKNISHRRLAAQLCGLFVTVEKEEFESRLKIISPLILKQFGIDETPGKFVKIHKEREEKETEEHQRVKDHHYFQVLQLLLKISSQCPSYLKQTDDIENLAIYVQKLLAYPHDWVRLASAQFIGFILSAADVEHLAKLLKENKSEEVGYLSRDPETSIKSLTLDLCDQLVPNNVKSDLAEQVIKNLVFVARVLQRVSLKQKEKINLLWLTKRMRKIVNTEVVESSTSITLRNEIFKWIAGVGTALDLENIIPILHHLLAPLVREMITTEEKNGPLRQLGKEVANLLKKRVGMDVYTQTLSNLQQSLSAKRAERKRSRTQLAVTDPELYAKKKIKRHEKKKDSKKRKIADLKGKKVFKKRKTVDLTDNSECM